MRKIFVSFLVLLCATAFTISVARADVNSSRPELRAFWVDGFNDGYKTPEQCDTLLARLRSTHCNAVFVQMRKRADAYYASHYEPWAADDPQHFDALEYLCRIAHEPGKPRIVVHAWVNACAVGGSKSANALPKLHPEWLSLSDGGATYDQEAVKIDPGNPEAADWTYRVYMDIVRRYDIDGIHMDFIRYGGSGKSVGHWGYNAVSVARYNASYGTSGSPAWDDPRWAQWRRDQVSALVRRIYVNAVAFNPKIIVSAATICWGDAPVTDNDYELKSPAYTGVFASWRDWLSEGILDLNCSMTYIDSTKRPLRWTAWQTFLQSHQYDRQTAMGVGIWMNTIPQSVWQVEQTRPVDTTILNPLAGTVMFSYASTDTTDGKENQYSEAFYSALTQPGLFTEDVAIPSMPWKEHPTLGHVMGMALNPETLAPLDGAEVCLVSGNDTMQEMQRTVTDGNGFFAIANLKPGEYNAFGSALSTTYTITVKPGEVTRIDPVIDHRTVSGVGRLQDGGIVTFANAIVTAGSDKLGDYFYIADAPGKPVVKVEYPHLVPPAISGDLVAVTGTITHEGGVPVVKAAAVRMLGAIVR